MTITQHTILPLKYGPFKISYHTTEYGDCVSVSYGNLQKRVPIVRLHSSCLFGESFHALDCDCAAQLTSTLKLIKKNKSGVIIYRYMEGRGIGLENKIKALELQRTHKINTVEAFLKLGFSSDVRNYDAEVRALRELDVNENIIVASQNPDKQKALELGGFTLVEQIHPLIKITEHNVQELMTKRDLLGYNIQLGTEEE